MSMKTNWCYNERTQLCYFHFHGFWWFAKHINDKITFHPYYFTHICCLCDCSVYLPQCPGGVWHSSPQWEPYRKPAAGWRWNSTRSWPSRRDPSHSPGERRSESTSGCWSTATFHHAAPWITSVAQQMCCDSALQNQHNVKLQQYCVV